MPSLLDMLGNNLGGDVVGQISRQIGAPQGETQNAMEAGIAAILGGLARNSEKPDGAAALHSALERDHDGSALSDIGGLLGGSSQAKGAGILNHVFGGKTKGIETGISKTSGLDQGSTNKLMEMLAPMVMGSLGKEQREKGLDASSLASLLGEQRREVEVKSPEGAGFIGKLLDQDGDGDFDIGDITKVGLGKLFGR